MLPPGILTRLDEHNDVFGHHPGGDAGSDDLRWATSLGISLGEPWAGDTPSGSASASGRVYRYL